VSRVRVTRLKLKTLINSNTNFFGTPCGMCCTGAACYNPEWEVYQNQNSVGATQISAPQSVQECLDYCGSEGSNCAAADVDLTQQPPACWIHRTEPSTMYLQLGTNQYRLRDRCATDTAGIASHNYSNNVSFRPESSQRFCRKSHHCVSEEES